MPAAEAALVAAMLAQIVWTFVVLVRTGRARFKAGRAGLAGPRMAIDSHDWPDDVRKIGNNLQNQFETPTLFYALVLLTLVLGRADWVLGVLAFVYVATRVAHTTIHTGSNVVLTRFKVFLAGVGSLMAMTAWLVVRLLIG